MSERQSSARQTSSEARVEFLRRAEELWDEFNGWYQEHPEATFDEMEAELGKRRRGILGDFVELGLRQGDLGATAEAPSCKECGQGMVFKGYPKKEIHGLEADAKIPRAYYVCPTCGVGIFPPGPTSTPEEG
ncbi:MAG: hypothetical protein P8189_29800 [Anaerolineae bacterium]|jgi:hypothetical protein